MLNPEQIPIGKLKQAFALSNNDTYELLSALLPDKVFPYALWQEAHDKFWQWSLKEAAYRDIDIPNFPEFPSLPDEHYPEQLHSTLMKRFFGEISRIIEISTLEKGINYIIENTYGDIPFPYQNQKESLFTSLREEERSERNWKRTSGLMHIDNIQSVDYTFITLSFIDTVVVNKNSAVNFLFNCGYPMRREVKGITQNLVDSVIKAAVQEAPPVFETAPAQEEPVAEIQPPEQGSVIRVSSSLFDGKSDTAVRDAMKAEYHESVIAYVMLKWCKIDKTRIGRLLTEKKYSDPKSYRNLVDGLIEKASAFTIIKA